MRLSFSRGWGLGVLGVSLFAGASAQAYTTSGGQDWDFEPDAWTRGNTADTSYFGWDELDDTGVILGFGQVLDDSTPDIGSGITASATRLYQGIDGLNDYSTSTYGHVSGTNNYYSGFGASDFANDTFTAVAPASGTGGYTTVVLQVIGTNLSSPEGGSGNALDDLSFEITGGSTTWTLQNSLYGLNEFNSGMYWLEWTAEGAGLEFAINMTSNSSHQSIDAFQVDTYWSATTPTVNAISELPEPSTALLLACGTLAMLKRRSGKPSEARS